MSGVIVIGAQWGDEGKGKMVDWLAAKADIVGRYQGGHNAGHTLMINVIQNSINKHIILVGLPGSGKSSVGKVLASKLGLKFLDSDHGVERLVGCSINDIFKYNGEDYFQSMEKKVISSMLHNDQLHVIATGGSTLALEETRLLIKEKSISVWLDASFDTLLNRISRKNTRPLFLDGDKADILNNMSKQISSWCHTSDIKITNDTGSHSEIADQIINRLKIYC